MKRINHGVTTLGELSMKADGLEVSVTGGDVALPLSSAGLQLVLDQLLSNSVAHGATEVSLRVRGRMLEVQDNGDGISEGNRDRIFDTFFTTRRDTGGTGMGLAIVASILRSHGAEITAPASEGGALFRIAFRPQ